MNFLKLSKTKSKGLTYLLIFVFMVAMLLSSGCQGPNSQSQKEAQIEDQSFQSPEQSKDEEQSSQIADDGKLRAHFIDVGQGDAILIQASGKNILIDGGDRDSVVVEYLKSQGIKRLDLVVGTHPHADHIGGLVEVLKEFEVKEVIDPGVITTSKTFEDYLTQIDQKDIKFTEGRAGITRELSDGVLMRLLHPTKPSTKNLNGASVVIRLSFGEIDFLFTGDAVNASEKEMLAQQGAYLNSEILKVSHHGSSSSTSAKFLKAVNPEIAIIMVGQDNSYGHPHQKTLNRLSKTKVKTYRTDLDQNILITTDGKTYEVKTGFR